MAFTTTIPGLPGGPLVTTYPIRVDLIAIDGYQRTGQPARTQGSLTLRGGVPQQATGR
jgi:hypothetical protein